MISLRTDVQEICRRRVSRHLSRRQNPMPVRPSARRNTVNGGDTTCGSEVVCWSRRCRFGGRLVRDRQRNAIRRGSTPRSRRPPIGLAVAWQIGGIGLRNIRSWYGRVGTGSQRGGLLGMRSRSRGLPAGFGRLTEILRLAAKTQSNGRDHRVAVHGRRPARSPTAAQRHRQRQQPDDVSPRPCHFFRLSFPSTPNTPHDQPQPVKCLRRGVESVRRRLITRAAGFSKCGLLGRQITWRVRIMR